MLLVEVDEAACSKVASRIKSIGLKKAQKAVIPKELGRELALRVLFFFSVINYDTRGLWGVVRGRFVRGSDYLLQTLISLAEEDPSSLDPASLATLKLEEFMSWFGGPSEGRLPRRPSERVALLRDAATKLLKHYGGSVVALLDACRGRVGGPDGLRKRLSEFKAFDDPLAKKIMVFAILSRSEGLWEPIDPENITVGVDYHLQRVALRSGMVVVLDEGLLRKLLFRRFVSAEEHNAMRVACLRAYELVGRFSGHSQLELDQLFWHLGRSCCHQERGPACGGRSPCTPGMMCSFLEATDYACGGACPLDGACRASLEPELTKLMEPKVITYYY